MLGHLSRLSAYKKYSDKKCAVWISCTKVQIYAMLTSLKWTGKHYILKDKMQAGRKMNLPGLNEAEADAQTAAV